MTLVPLWVLCLGLQIGAPAPSIAVHVRPSAGGPIVTELDPSMAPGLRHGDRIVRIGDREMHDAGRIETALRILEGSDPDGQTPLVVERSGEEIAATLRLHEAAPVWPRSLASVLFAITGVLVLLRAGTNPTASAVFRVSLCAAFEFAGDFGGRPWLYLQPIVKPTAVALVAPLAIRALQVFPGFEEPRSRWSRAWPWLFLVVGPLQTSVNWGVPFPWSVGRWILAVSIAAYAAAVVVAARNYARATAVQRRQMRWVVFGGYCVTLVVVVAMAAGLRDPDLLKYSYVTQGVVSFIPLAVLISVLRFDLFDIDRLLSATMSSNLVLFAAIALGSQLVPAVAEAASSALGLDPSSGRVGVSLVLAALVIPGYQLLRPRIDRLLFPERYAVDRGIETILHDLGHCDDVNELVARLGEGLDRLLRPENCVIYNRHATTWAPVFVRGRGVPPTLDPSVPLPETLAERRAAPLRGPRSIRSQLAPFNRAALDGIGAEVLVPVFRAGDLMLLVCLGRKRSGDVYTPVDLVLLGAVGNRASVELLRFDQAEVVREAKALQQRLRRYVPGAIADRLASGDELESGEREVSVLFVDIRGYTQLAESLRPDEIFSTVNRYTSAVSSVVEENGGSVVEFNGDGMMAVFGAPRDHPHKERAAVEAARRIVEQVARPSPSGEAIRVGVGIATGIAFVGNVRAVDRMIWTALGNTTNLAARLQGLTREIDAAIVIDAATQAAAREATKDFVEHRGVAIRGLRRTREVFALPLRAV